MQCQANMTKNYFIGFLAAALVLGGIIGYIVAPSSLNGVNLGASNPSSSVISYYSSLSKQVLWDSLNSLLMDINKVRAPLAGVIAASATWNPSSMAAATTTGVGLGVISGYTTTTLTLTGAAVGDFVIVSFDSATSTDLWTISGKVSAASTALITIVNYSTAALDLTTSTLRARVLPQSTFAAPASLQTSTSTSY